MNGVIVGKLDGKVAVITGATSGMALAMFPEPMMLMLLTSSLRSLAISDGMYTGLSA